MKKLIYFLNAIAILAIFSVVCNAQADYIYTVAGNGTSGYSGDGGPALNAELSNPSDVCLDNAGNIYIADRGNQRIRKVNSVTKVITTVAGNGTSGYSGDGGLATSAELNQPNGVSVDGYGNIYIADKGNNRIRMVNTSGIISTVAGGGNGGDGGPAIGASVNNPTDVAVDAVGNFYISQDGSQVIRKVNASGIISTIAGGGGGSIVTGAVATSVSICGQNSVAVDAVGNVYFTDYTCGKFSKVDPSGILSIVAGTSPGFAGDGGPAIAAQIEFPYGISADIFGNVYLAPQGNIRIRKVDGATGIINTIAGTGTDGYSGDNGPATNAEISSSAYGVYSDIVGNVYFADQGNQRIRMITSSIIATYSCGSFSVFVNEFCGGPQLTVATATYSPSYNVKTYFGDLTTTPSAIQSGYGGTSGYATFTHNYALPGTYTLKTILFDGTTPLDSMSYTYEYKMCNNISVQYYNDANNNCVYDADSDFNIMQSMLTEVDSNNVPVDTISSASGFYYTAYGTPGDVYSFKIISMPGSLVASCPATGIITHTLQAGAYNVVTEYIGLRCSAATSFDLSVDAVVPVTGTHDQWGNIYIRNSYCQPSNATVTLSFSPKYVFTGGASPIPSSVSGNNITWNLTGLSSNDPNPVGLYYEIWSPATGPLTIGDTVDEHITVTPTVGDTDAANNSIVIHDTVKGSCDPNLIEVAPAGRIVSGWQLKYKIEFENVGNDTAHNIYVLDTLPSQLDANTLRIVSSTHAMNVAAIKNGAYNIVKFDFPHINLLDSSHHEACTGTFTYTIMSKTGLPDGTLIDHRAGIYFDDNGLVLTNTVENIVGFPESVSNVSNENKVELYPNPVIDELVIKTNESYNSLVIRNGMGQVVEQKEINSTTTRINVKQLPAGLYYINLVGNKGSDVRKFVKR